MIDEDLEGLKLDLIDGLRGERVIFIDGAFDLKNVGAFEGLSEGKGEDLTDIMIVDEIIGMTDGILDGCNVKGNVVELLVGFRDNLIDGTILRL